MNEFRDVFKKERDKEVKETRENRVNKTDRSDLESIVQMIFNRFKASIGVIRSHMKILKEVPGKLPGSPYGSP